MSKNTAIIQIYNIRAKVRLIKQSKLGERDIFNNISLLC